MAISKTMFQPGAILHEVIVGALRAKGTSFAGWCESNGINIASAKSATYGQSGGDRGQEILKALIEEAGPKVVEAAYRQRMLLEAEKLEGAAA